MDAFRNQRTPYPAALQKLGGPGKPGGAPKAGSAGWKSYTAARWSAHHPFAGQEGRDPVTGDPMMKSTHQIRAEANANAWKSIAAMQKALPSVENINAPYNAQRSQIESLVNTHRAWLEQAGQYQTQMANQLGAIAGATVRGADAVQGGNAAAAGGNAAMLPSSNVSPDAIGAPVAYGSNFGSYLGSLIPSATAQGIGNIQSVNAAQDSALRDYTDKRAAIAGQYPDIQQAQFKTSYELALDQYKSELAALANTSKTSMDVAKFKEDVRYHTGLLGASEDRNRIAAQRAQNALTKVGGRTAGDASGLKAALAKADLMMHPKATTGAASKKHTRYGVQVVLPSTTDPNTFVQTQVQRKSFGGKTPEGVRKQLNAFMAKNQKLGWTVAAGNAGRIRPDTSYDVSTPGGTTGGQPSYASRQSAWRYLVAQNQASLHPVDRASLLQLFRSMEGAP